MHVKETIASSRHKQNGCINKRTSHTKRPVMVESSDHYRSFVQSKYCNLPNRFLIGQLASCNIAKYIARSNGTACPTVTLSKRHCHCTAGNI